MWSMLAASWCGAFRYYFSTPGAGVGLGKVRVLDSNEPYILTVHQKDVSTAARWNTDPYTYTEPRRGCVETTPSPLRPSLPQPIQAAWVDTQAAPSRSRPPG